MTERAGSNIIKFRQRRRPNKIINGAARITLAASSIATAAGIAWITKDNFSTKNAPSVTLQRSSGFTSGNEIYLSGIKPPGTDFKTNRENFSLVVLGSTAFIVSLGVLANLEDKKLFLS